MQLNQQSERSEHDWSELDRLVAVGDVAAAVAWCNQNGVPLEVAIVHVGATQPRGAGIEFIPLVGEVLL